MSRNGADHMFHACDLSFKRWLVKLLDRKNLEKRIDFQINWGMGRTVCCPLVKWMIDGDIGMCTARYLYMTTEKSSTLQGKSLINTFLRFENLIPDIEKEFGTGKILPSKINTSDHLHYSTYYDDNLMNIVAHKDRMIIDQFGYKFEKKS